jgi:hypothetical protein
MKMIMKRIIIILLFSVTQMFAQHYIWRQMNTQTTYDLNYMTQFYAVGNNGTYLRYDSMDSTWKNFNTAVSSNLKWASGLSGNVYAAGTGGVVIKSTDWGLSWNALNTGTTININSIYTFSGLRILCACDNGKILYSSNSGVNWTLNTVSQYDLYCINSIGSFLWVTGGNGTLLRSDNQGLNWTQVNINTSSKLNYISNTNPMLLCGDNSVLFKSADNGTTWIPVMTGFGGNYTCALPYILSTSNGNIISSSDMGSSWYLELISGSSINFITSNSFACGTGGRIYKKVFVPLVNTKYIDCNTIRTPFRNNGSFNRDPETGNSGFEWPKGSNKYARYASGLWLGAIVDGDTLVALAEYDYEYSGGYTDNNGNYQGKNDTNYRIYKLDYGVNNYDRTSWPNILLGNSNQGAPVFYDEGQGLWKPLDMGSQTMFMSFSDSDTAAHQVIAGSTLPLKADVKMLNFANGGPSGPLANAIFTQYIIINRSSKVWNNMYISVFSDDDIGDATDDMYACDSGLSLGYMYNGDNNDGVYGAAPPAVGFLVLKGANFYTGNPNDTLKYCVNKNIQIKTGYKDLNLTAARWIEKGSPGLYGEPNNYRESYNTMTGRYRNGSIIYHPNGFPTTFTFSGDPVTSQGWVTIPQAPMDNRFLISSGPITMNPGDTQTIVFAQIIARGNSNLNSITVLRQYAQQVRDYYNSCYTSVPIGIEPISQNIPDKFELYQNYPNPFNPKTILRFALPEGRGQRTEVRLIIYNALGQVVETLVNESAGSGLNAGTYEVEFDGSNLASGVYYYSLIVRSETIRTRKMVLVK